MRVTDATHAHARTSQGGGGVRDDPHRATRNSDTHTPNRKPEPEPSSNLSHIGTLTTRQVYCQGVKVKASNIAWPNADAFYGLWTHTAPPEALVKAPAHSPSTMPLTCPVARPSQRELHKDGGGGGGGLARRARAARAPKARSFATSCGTSSATSSVASCAASFTCSSFTCHLRGGVGGGTRELSVGSKAALAADRTSSGVGLASGSPRTAAYLYFAL